MGRVPDGSVLGSLTAYTSTVKDGPVFVHRVGQTHTWDSLFLSDGGCDKLAAVAQAAKDAEAVDDPAPGNRTNAQR